MSSTVVAVRSQLLGQLGMSIYRTNCPLVILRNTESYRFLDEEFCP